MEHVGAIVKLLATHHIHISTGLRVAQLGVRDVSKLSSLSLSDFAVVSGDAVLFGGGTGGWKQFCVSSLRSEAGLC